MKYKLSDIEQRVYALLDENRSVLEDRVEYGDPETSLRSLIREITPQAACKVLLSVQASEIDEFQTDIDTSALRHPDERRAILPLPPKFLRLLYFRMSDWWQGVSETLVFGGTEYQLYSRRHEPGYPLYRRNPAVVIGPFFGKRSLEIYNTGKDATVAEAAYIESPEFDGNRIDLPRGLFDAICQETASMIDAITRHS